jgi:CHAT domain-containing protein
MTRWVTTVALLALAASARSAAPPERQTLARFHQIEEATRMNLRAVDLYRAGKWPEATRVFADVLRLREKLYPEARFPQGHPELATSINNLAYLYRAQGQYPRAEPLFVRALRMREKLYPRTRYPQGHSDLATSINNLAVQYYVQGDHARAEPLFRRVLHMYEALYPREKYPRGHPALGLGINNLAVLHKEQGQYAAAETLYRRALRLFEELYPRAEYPQGHPDLATSINNLADLHLEQGDYARAELLYRRALHMREGLYPRTRFPHGHHDLASSINNLAVVLKEQGEYARAEPLLRRALEMKEALYPKARYPQGHPDLALSINNLALLLDMQQDYARAEPLYRRALEMKEALYPKARYPQGHPDLALGLNNLAMLLDSRGEYAKAEPLFRRALVMREALYPKERYPQGHPHLALSLTNLAKLLDSRGEGAKAEPLYRRALEMREALFPPGRYPQGHPRLAHSILNLAAWHQKRGQFAKAEPLFRRALEMYAASAAALATSVPEATSLNYLASLPKARDLYLVATRPPHQADAYPTVWQSKAALSRLYERRHLAVLAASSSQARTLWDAVLALRRQRERLLLAPAAPAQARARDTRLDAIDEEVRKKEEELLPLLPALKRSEELARATPADLRMALPADTALVDLVRYVHVEHDSSRPGKKGEKHTPRYVAFVVTRQGVQRVELGEAKPVEELLELWRRALQEGSPAEPGYAAKVHALLWAPVRKHLPRKVSLVHVSPDAALNRLPWAALRDGNRGRILIEEHAVAVVPHGVMLLDRLTEQKPRRQAQSALLALGGVAYDREPRAARELALRGPVGDAVKWATLPGTEKELKQVVALAGDRRVVRLEGAAAGAEALRAGLPAARTAHLATHGFFADARFRSVMQFDEKLFRSTKFPGGGDPRRFGAGSRSPMVLSGLVCSGANLSDTPNRGVLTAEAIAGLDLRRMNLAVLSACETGLGDTAGGEGVYGLVRAFHVAGCRNVAASLWKVDDQATAALMVLFYRHLWGKEKMSAAEALRRAQLAVYREPGRIKEWSQGRGPLPTPIHGSGKAAEKLPAGKTSPARAWAAFVISGPGD